jgi:type VI secretion system secreted protein VgrG
MIMKKESAMIRCVARIAFVIPLMGFLSSPASASILGSAINFAVGNPNAIFVFQIGSTLTTASLATVNVINGGTTTGVYWDIGSSATLGTDTAFAGNILALTSITLNTGAKILCGRAFAQNGAVTMDTNTISNNCSAGGDFGSGRSDFGSEGFSGGALPAPEPGTAEFFGVGLLLALTVKARRLASPPLGPRTTPGRIRHSEDAARLGGF